VRKQFRKFVAQNVIDESFRYCNMEIHMQTLLLTCLILSLSVFIISYLCIILAYSRLSIIDYPLF